MFEEMTTLEVYKHRTILRPKARQIIIEHKQTFADFLKEVGDRDSYTGKEVFEWLGY